MYSVKRLSEKYTKIIDGIKGMHYIDRMRNTRPMHAARDDYDRLFFCDVHEIWHKDDLCPDCYEEGKGDRQRDECKDSQP